MIAVLGHPYLNSYIRNVFNKFEMANAYRTVTTIAMDGMNEQVEIHPLWRQKKLREFCKAKGIQLCAYSPLGGIGDFWGQDWVMKCNVLNEIAAMRGKTTAQVPHCIIIVV